MYVNTSMGSGMKGYRSDHRYQQSSRCYSDKVS